MRVFAIRGATTVDANEAGAIRSASRELVHELLQRNGLRAGDLVSAIFTLTQDLDAACPATTAQQMGLADVPLICTNEIAVPRQLPRVIRALVHYQAPVEHAPQHVYLREARSLRPDLAAMDRQGQEPDRSSVSEYG